MRTWRGQWRHVKRWGHLVVADSGLRRRGGRPLPVPRNAISQEASFGVLGDAFEVWILRFAGDG